MGCISSTLARGRLIIAIENGDAAALRQILSTNENIDVNVGRGFTALMLAVSQDRPECARVLLEAGADIDSTENTTGLYCTALMLAVGVGHLECARLLLEAGADIDKVDKNGNTALMLAVGQDRPECARLLLEAGADIDKVNKDGITALMVAVEKGHLECARLLLEAGADIDKVHKDGNTALMVAVGVGHLECARLLLEAGADIDSTENTTGLYCTALMVAVGVGHLECARLLLEAGADIDKVNKNGITALMLAVGKGHLECARLLLEAGADIDKVNKNGNTALMLAVGKGHLECARLLLEAGAIVNVQDHKGNTGLIVAVQRCASLNDVIAQTKGNARDMIHLMSGILMVYSPIVELLMGYGADPAIVNNDGDDALACARRSGITKVIDVIERPDTVPKFTQNARPAPPHRPKKEKPAAVQKEAPLDGKRELSHEQPAFNMSPQLSKQQTELSTDSGPSAPPLSMIGSFQAPPPRPLPHADPPHTPVPPLASPAQANKSPFMMNSSNSILQTDPLLSMVASSTNVSTMNPTQSGKSNTSGGSSNRTALDIRPWQLEFKDLVIEKAIGEGSFGRCYLAHWHETKVVAKVLLDSSITESQAAGLSLSSPMLNKLQDEAALMASLRHPNIVMFMGVCTFPPCIVTEYCSKGDLTGLLRLAKRDTATAKSLTWSLRLRMVIEAAQGMLFLHNHRPQVVHRDLKSPNLLVDQDLHIKIADFNLSKIIEEVDVQTSAGGASNPRWLPPEVLSGAKFTAAGDVFAFGVVMWELLMWDIPWVRTNQFQIPGIVMGGGRLEVPNNKGELPGYGAKDFKGLDGYVALMRRCWAQRPEDRPGFGEVIAELRKLG